MSWFLHLLPGAILVAIVQITAGWLAGYVTLFDALTIGILLGILLNNLLSLPSWVRPGTKFIEKRILQLGIILLGIELNFALIWRLGGKIIFLIVFTVSFGLFAAWLLGRIFGINNKLAMLLGVGSSVCGASAIAAVEPIMEPSKEDVAIAVAGVSLLGAAGVLLYPLFGQVLQMESLAYGIWAGVSLQGVAHAVAAAFAFGDLSGEIGTLVKMGRVVMLAPVALFLNWRYAPQSGGRRTGKLLPLEVIGFISVGALATWGVLTRNLDLGIMVIDLKALSKNFITAAMVAMGLGVNLKSIGRKGWRALLMGATLFAVLALVTWLLVKLLVVS